MTDEMRAVVENPANTVEVVDAPGFASSPSASALGRAMTGAPPGPYPPGRVLLRAVGTFELVLTPPEAERCPPECVCKGQLTPAECERRLRSFWSAALGRLSLAGRLGAGSSRVTAGALPAPATTAAERRNWL